MRADEVRTAITPVVHRRLLLISALALAVVTSGYMLFCALNGLRPGERLFRLYTLIYLLLVMSWLATDPAIPSACRPSFDHAMLLWMSFPVYAGMQMFAAHRWRGLLMVLGLLALASLPGIVLHAAWHPK
jgi:hypothetical protein